MRIKKALATFVAGTFLFGSMATANAAQFSDIAGKDAASAIQKLNALGIINGYEDGTFKPEGEITRAEFAKISVIAAGMEDSADLLKDSASPYSDVKAGAWYTGWVNIASSQGFLKGYPNGTFAPNANITYAEAITILMRILGYDDRLPGNWPVDYISRAAKEDVTKDVTFTASAKATRGDVAMLASNTLEADMVEYDKEAYDIFDKQGKTLLEDSFENALVEDVFVTDWDKTDDEYSIDFEAWDEDTDTWDADSLNFNDDFVVANAGSVSGLNERVVDYIVNDDNEIIYAEAKDYGVVKSDDVEFDAAKSVKNNDDNKSYKFATNIRYGAGVTAATDGTQDTMEEYKAVLDEDGRVVYVEANDAGLAQVVEEVKSDEINFYTGTDFTPDDDEEYVIIKDGKEVEIADVKQGDVVYQSNNANSQDYVLWVYGKSVTGELTTAATDMSTVTIDGTKYDLEDLAQVKVSFDGGDEVEDLDNDNVEDLFGEDVKVVFSKFGDVAYLEAVTDGDAGKLKGVVTDVFEGTKDGKKVTYVEILKADDTQVSYVVDDTDDLVAGVRVSDFEGVIADMSTKYQFVEYVVTSGGELDAEKLEILDGSADEAADFDTYLGDTATSNTDADDMRLNIDGGTKVVADDAVVFNLNPDSVDTDEDAETVSVKDFLKAAETTVYTSVIYSLNSDDEVEYIVIDDTVTTNEDVAAIVSTGRDADGKYVMVLKDGATEAVKIYTSGSAETNVSDLDEGSIISYTLKDGDIDAFVEEVNEDVYGKATATWLTGKLGAGVVVDEIEKVNGNNVKFNNDANWYLLNDDTIYFDATSDAPEAASKDDVSADVYAAYSVNASDEIEWIVLLPAND